MVLLLSRLLANITRPCVVCISLFVFNALNCTYANRQNTSTTWRARTYRPLFRRSRPLCGGPADAVGPLCVCVFGLQLSNEMTFDLDIRHDGSL